MRTLLLWITSFLPYREISDGNTPYLERYYLGSLLGWRFYIHRFVGSDPDRGLHDHPWRFAISLILSGWYLEETRTGIHRVRWLNFLTADTFHRVILPPVMVPSCNALCKYVPHPTQRQECWTLFAHTAGDAKRWGFWRPISGDDVPEDAAVYHPYTYEREGSQREWWITAGRRPKP